MSASQTDGMSGFSVEAVTAHRARQEVGPLRCLDRHSYLKKYKNSTRSSLTVKQKQIESLFTCSARCFVGLVDSVMVGRTTYDHWSREKTASDATTD